MVPMQKRMKKVAPAVESIMCIASMNTATADAITITTMTTMSAGAIMTTAVDAVAIMSAGKR